MSYKLLASEAATLRYIKSRTDLPVPEVYDYCDTADNEVGIPYILMSEAPGKPLSKSWLSAGSYLPDLATDKKAKELSQLRFDKIGSLFEEGGEFKVEECLSRGHVVDQRCTLEEVPRGPFTCATSFYDSLVSAFVQHAETLQLSHHCFVAPIPSTDAYQSRDNYRTAVDLWNDFVTIGNKIDSSDNRLDYIVAGDALRNIVPQLMRPTLSPNFPLCHGDLSINNIYVDDDYNITCIIDWAFTSSVPESTLFVPPGLPQSRNEISPELYAAFIDGFLTAVSGSLGNTLHDEYHKLLKRCKPFWSLTRLLSLDCTADYHLFATVWDAAYGGKKDIGAYFEQQRSSTHYPASEIEKEELSYFQNNALRNAIAKELTILSQWNRQYSTARLPTVRNNMFVADDRLWKWVMQWMQEWECL
ncbi:hypothetical protein BJX96DRAFT_165647 [Aspergillus floccosus]